MPEKYITKDKGPSIKPLGKPNVLHKFASYNTIFTLSGVTEQELRSHKFLTNPVHDIIARTGGIGEAKVQTRQFKENNQEAEAFRTLIKDFEKKRYYEQYQDSIDILDRDHDLFIENVNIISTVGPNAERNLGNFTKMEFEIHEPYGITFIEKVRASTAINGFIDYQDAPVLLTMEFKGFDENGNAYRQPSTTSHIRKIPILISRVDFDVNEGGARYTVVAVPYTDLAFDDRFKYPRTGMPIQGLDANDWARKAEQVLNETMMEQEIKEQVRVFPDTYEFDIAPEVIERGGKYKNKEQSTNSSGDVQDYDIFYNVETLDPPETKVKTGEAKADSSVSLTKFFEDAIRASYGYQQLANDFWTTYLRANTQYSDEVLKDKKKVNTILRSKQFEDILLKNQYVDWFKIKTTVETPEPGKIDPITKMSPKKIIFQAVPYRIHILKFVQPGVSLGSVDWSAKVQKQYDFIYTGDNIDVQGLRINYKTAYYLRNVRGDDKDETEKGLVSFIGDAFKNVFGKEKDPEPLLPLRQYPSSIKGRNTLQTLSGEANKAQQFYDYLTNPEVDMMRIDLDILGDPSYICQDIYVPIHQDRKTIFGVKGEIYNDTAGSFNADQFQPIILVRYRLPDDVDEKEGTMFSAKQQFRDENLFFNGLYQVNKIESRFENGQFTQTLSCSRFNNQQGQGLPPLLTNASTSSITKIEESVNNSKTKTVKEKIQENNPRLKKFMDDVEQINSDFPV